MAFPDINAYTADEVVSAKDEMDEISSIMTALIAKTRAVSGLYTDEERELQRVLTVVDARAAGLASAPADIIAVAAVKAALALGTFAADQVDAATEAAAEAEALAQAVVIANGDAETAVTKVSYTAAIAGTVEDANGTDGSYVFTVAITSGLIADVSAELTLAITATPYVA
ncbi:MAG: hypothetical protein K0M69_15770 [Youngiibacter sp.]|nr:hypothetical protein [Youngiibacter sp.]